MEYGEYGINLKSRREEERERDLAKLGGSSKDWRGGASSLIGIHGPSISSTKKKSDTTPLKYTQLRGRGCTMI
jgi:hypothetical protein